MRCAFASLRVATHLMTYVEPYVGKVLTRGPRLVPSTAPGLVAYGEVDVLDVRATHSAAAVAIEHVVVHTLVHLE